MKKFCALVVLILSLTISTYADCASEGHMGCPGTVRPTTQLAPANTDETDYPVLQEMALSLLQSILSLS
jgi:hypothetical protein